MRGGELKILIACIFLVASFIVSAEMVGQKVPFCPAKINASEQNIDFEKYRGKVILIDFWATWCPPCKQSMPFLNALRNELVSQGFEIIAINVDDDREGALAFLKAYPVDYLLGFDSSGVCPSTFDVKAMPSSYFIDKQGRVRDIHLGYRENDQRYIRNKITELLAEKRP